MRQSSCRQEAFRCRQGQLYDQMRQGRRWHLEHPPTRKPTGWSGRLMSEMAEADPSTQRLRRRLELVRAHVDCENRHNLEGILQTFGAAIAYEDQAWRTRHPGSEGVRFYYEEFLHACADLRVEVHAEHVCKRRLFWR
jgi:hypothetical protein